MVILNIRSAKRVGVGLAITTEIELPICAPGNELAVPRVTIGLQERIAGLALP